MGESSSTENKSQSLPEGIAVKSIYKALKNNVKIWMTKALRYAIFKPFYARIVIFFLQLEASTVGVQFSFTSRDNCICASVSL